MMLGYKNQPEKTREGYWTDPGDGTVWQRMGDVGRIDAQGFVELVGRTKDVIISGGFNVFRSTLKWNWPRTTAWSRRRWSAFLRTSGAKPRWASWC